MMRAMYAADSGLSAEQMMLDTTAADIANVNTVGYKGSRTTFQDELAQMITNGSAPAPGDGGTNAVAVGLGTTLGSIDNEMSQGALETTGNPLDVAISGDGWFRVGNSTAPAVPSTIEYTRAGNFTTDDQGYLTTQNGQYVIGRSAPGSGGTDELIQIPPGSGDVSVGSDGSVTYVPAGGGARATAGYLSLATFANEGGLERAGDNNWVTGLNSGPEQVGTPNTGTYGQTVGGSLEMSNVDLSTEFTNMMSAQNGFDANSRVISTADQMLQTLVDMIQ